VLVEKLLRDLDLREEGGLVQILDGARPFMLAGLQQIDAVTGTVESDFALLAAALRADAPVDGRAKALLLPFFAEGATHRYQTSRRHYDTQGMPPRAQCPRWRAILKPAGRKLAFFMAFARAKLRTSA
jgi:hypothetical protein